MVSHCSYAALKDWGSCHSTQRYFHKAIAPVDAVVIVVGCVGEVYAIGGYNGVKTVDVVEKYNPEGGTWREVAPLVFGRSVPGIAVAYLWPVQSTMKSFWEPESQL